MMIQNEKNYDNIINLPHHISPVHPPLSDSQRATQFLPFAALTRYEEALRKTAAKAEQEAQ